MIRLSIITSALLLGLISCNTSTDSQTSESNQTTESNQTIENNQTIEDKQTNESNQTTEEKQTNLIKVNTDFVKTLEGKIGGKYDILAKLTSNKGAIEGTYFYKKTGGNIQLKGNIDSTGAIEIKEYNSKGNQTGVFKGKFSDNRIDGNWSKPNDTSTTAFYLIESNTNYEAYQQQVIKQKEAKKKTSLPPANFAGFWSDEGNIDINSRLVLLFRPIRHCKLYH